MAACQGFPKGLYSPEYFITNSQSSSQVSVSLKARNARLGVEVCQHFNKHLEFSPDGKLKQRYVGTVNFIFVYNKGTPKLSMYLVYISHDFSPVVVLTQKNGRRHLKYSHLSMFCLKLAVLFTLALANWRLEGKNKANAPKLLHYADIFQVSLFLPNPSIIWLTRTQST